MGIKRPVLIIIIFLTVFSLPACNFAETLNDLYHRVDDFQTADINLCNIKLTDISVNYSSAYYLSEDGTLYSPGADVDAGCYVAYRDPENGIVAKNVRFYGEMIYGGYYIDTNNSLYVWSCEDLSAYGNVPARTHTQIMDGVKSVVSASRDAIVYVDLNGDLYVIGTYEDAAYSAENPNLLAKDVSVLSTSPSGSATYILNNGEIKGNGDKTIMEELNHRFSGSDISDIQVTRDYATVLSNGELWFYGDYDNFISGNEAQECEWMYLADNIARISCDYRTMGAIDAQGNLILWGRAITDNGKNGESPDFAPYENEVIASNTKNLYISGGIVAYIDFEGQAHIYYDSGYVDWYGNSTTDEVVGIGREPNTWVP